MSEEVARNSRMTLPDLFIYHQEVVYKCFITTGIEVAEVFACNHGLTVTSVVVDHAHIAVSAEELHKRKVPFLVFAHSVGELHDTFTRVASLRLGDEAADLDAVEA